MVTATAPAKLTLGDIGRQKRFSREEIARKTGIDMSWVSRVFSTKYPTVVCSIKRASKIAAVLGITTEEFITFLREECGKDI